jgi:hypothetical protein
MTGIVELIEQGPEAAATRARLTNREIVFIGEGARPDGAIASR